MTTIDEAKLGSLVEQLVGHMTGGAVCFSTLLGDELGLYQVLDGAGGPYRSGAHSYSASSSAMPGAVDRSTEDARSSSTSRRE